MTITLTLPSLVAGRDLADDFVDELGELTGQDVRIDARELTSGTASFAAQLVRRILVDGRANRLTVIGAPSSFVRNLRSAAVNVERSTDLETLDGSGLVAAS